MIAVIAQNVDIYPGDGKHPFARTGELSFSHVRNAGAKGTLIGHSEVGEGVDVVNQKLKAAFNARLEKNIVLFGDRWEDLGKPWEELDAEGRMRVVEVVRQKFIHIVEDVSSRQIEKTVLAYEPAWGVHGSGKHDVSGVSVDQIEQVVSVLRETLEKIFGESVARSTRIVYGGSMSPSRTKEIMAISEIDGFGAGHDSTKTLWVKEMAAGIAAVKKQRTPVLFLNWKAYELDQPYEKFLEILKPFESASDIYLAPPATDIAMLAQLL